MRFFKDNLPKLAFIVALVILWLFAVKAHAGIIFNRSSVVQQSSCPGGVCPVAVKPSTTNAAPTVAAPVQVVPANSMTRTTATVTESTKTYRFPKLHPFKK